MRRGWTVAIGVTAIVVSAFTFVLLPIVVALVAAWWLATDARSTGARAPGTFGKIALVMLASCWVAVAALVLAFDAHFDCGGTLGGFGESANARLDDACYDRRSLRVLIAAPVVLLGAAGAGVWFRRWSADSPGDGSEATHRRSPAVAASVVVGGCTLVWTAVIVVLVVL